MDIKSQLPVIIRYLLVTAFTVLTTRGLISPEAQSILSSNIDIIVGAVGGLATVAYALWRRPSAKALEVAKQVDAKVPADQPVLITTPPGTPDIVVPAKQ